MTGTAIGRMARAGAIGAVASVAIAVPGWAQVVRGQVRDTLTTAPLANATITVTDAARRAVATLTTSADGSFVLTGLARGAHELSIRRLGYSPKTLTFNFSSRDTLVVAWMLQSATILKPVETRARWLGSWWRPRLTSGAEYVRRHIALGKGVIVTGAEIRASGLPMTEYLATFEGIVLTPVAAPSSPVVPGSRGRFLSSVYGAHCLYARIDRITMAYHLIDQNVEDVDGLLKIEDIMAVEVFRNSHELPPEWKVDAGIEGLIERRNGGLRYVMGYSERPMITPEMWHNDTLFESSQVFGSANAGRMPKRPRDFVESHVGTARTIQSAPICDFMQIWTRTAW